MGAKGLKCWIVLLELTRCLWSFVERNGRKVVPWRIKNMTTKSFWFGCVVCSSKTVTTQKKQVYEHIRSKPYCKGPSILERYTIDVYLYIYIWMFPKIVGFPPKSSILIGVFHYKPSILGCFPIFGNIHIYQLLRLFHECHFEPSALPGEPWQKFDARSHKTEPPFYLELKQPKLEIGDNTMGKSTCNL